MRIASRLGLPSTLSRPLQLAVLFYLAHLLCEPWIGSSQIFLGLSIIAAGIAVARHDLTVPFHRLYLPLGLYLAASTTAALVSDHPMKSVGDVGEWMNFLVLPLGLALYQRVPESRRIALRVFVFLGSMMAVWGLVQFFVLGDRDLEHRIHGPAAHVMTYSGIILLLSLFALGLVRRRGTAGLLMMGSLTAFALVLTFTRSAWLGWAVGFFALVFMRRPRWLILAVPLLILAVTFSPLEIFGRMVSSFDVQQSSNLDRIRMAQAGVEMVRDHPLFGVGPGNVKEMYPFYRAADAPRFRIPHLHDNLIQIWAESGILALAGYLLFLGMFLDLCLRGRKGPPISRGFAGAGLAALVGITIAGLFEFNFGDSEVAMTMLDLFALALTWMASSEAVAERVDDGQAVAAN